MYVLHLCVNNSCCRHSPIIMGQSCTAPAEFRVSSLKIWVRIACNFKFHLAYQISPKPCWVDGMEGTCMFVYECIKSEGYHIGMCVDSFMFGSCCAYNTSDNTVVSSNHGHPSVLYTVPSHSHTHVTSRPINSYNSKATSRPRPAR